MHHISFPASQSPSVLETDEWLRWNERTWGLRPVRVSYTRAEGGGPRLDGVLYLDKRGAVRTPPLNPYMPFVFHPTETKRTNHLTSQWLSVTSALADDLLERGLVGSIALPPGLLDARAFQWAGFDVQIRYTMVAKLPVLLSTVDGAVRKRIRKAKELGYIAGRSTDWSAIAECLTSTESEKRFAHHLTLAALEYGAEHLGWEQFRGYEIRNPVGKLVSGGVRLVARNGLALDWVQGAYRGDLQNGVNQLMYAYVLDDLLGAGATEFDYGGANIPEVARAKAAWGIPLTPYVLVSSRDLRYALREMRSVRRLSSVRRQHRKALRA